MHWKSFLAQKGARVCWEALAPQQDIVTVLPHPAESSSHAYIGVAERCSELFGVGVSEQVELSTVSFFVGVLRHTAELRSLQELVGEY